MYVSLFPCICVNEEAEKFVVDMSDVNTWAGSPPVYKVFTSLQKSSRVLHWSTTLSSPNTVSSVKGGRRQVSCRRTGGQTRGIKGRLRLVEWRMFNVSVLGQDVGYTVKFNTLPEGVPKGKAQGNYWRQRVIFDRISWTEPVYRGCSTITSVTD